MIKPRQHAERPTTETKPGQRFRITDFILRFRELTKKTKLNQRLQTKDAIRSHNSIAEKMFSEFLIIPKVPEDEVDRRVLNSEAVHLFALLASGALDSEPDIERQIDLAEQFLARISAKNKEERMAGREGRLGTDPITLGMELKFSMNAKTAVGATLIKNSQVYVEEKNETKNAERKTSPTASARTFLREILTSLKLGWKPSEWIIHETVSVALNADHTEIMDVTAMQAAAGLLFPDSAPTKKGELHNKPSGDEYFPFHKARSKNRFIDKLVRYARKDGDYTEVRSLIYHNPIEFARLVRQVTFLYLASFGIQAVQKEASLRTPTEKQLARCFQELSAKWSALLEQANIHNPTNAERVTEYTDINIGMKRTKYNILIYALSKYHEKTIQIQRKRDDGELEIIQMTVRERTKQLIREYNREVRKILQY